MPTSQWSSRASLAFVVSFLLLTLFLIFLAVLHTASASPPSPATSAGTLPSAPTDANCWQIVSSPSPPSSTSRLYAITAIGPDDLWAVGSSGPNTNTTTLIEHWDGASWTIVPSPSPGASSTLHGIDASSATDIWAVGSTDSQPLVLHYDASSQWSVSSLPYFPAGGSLLGVKAFSPDDVWAVGDNAGDGHRPVLHKTAQGWSTVLLPVEASLSSIDGPTPNDLWVVGTMMVLHWDGVAWNVSQVPLPSDCYNGIYTLLGISALASNDVWTVGTCPLREAGTALALTFHWDGTQWSYFGPDLYFFQAPVLTSVDAIAPNDVWAVGYQSGLYPNTRVETVAIHWDGANWIPVSTPHQGTADNYLYGVAMVAHDNVWSVGTFGDQSGNGQTLVQHYAPCPSPCPGERFTDVCPDDYFYAPVQALANDGILSGYSTAPPCPNSLWIPCFRPYTRITRGQIAKVVSLAAGFNEPVSGQTFYDMPPGSPFYEYAERLAARGIMQGYPFGSGDCPQQNLPCFFPNRPTTRGQLSKIVSLAFQFTEPVTGQTFQDVPPAATFYTYTERLASRAIILGYPCGGPTEPCIPPENRSYFRTNANVTRGQTAKIVQLARTQPTPTPTSTTTSTTTATMTPALILTPSATPTCCSGVTASISGSCQGSEYWVSYTITNSCTMTTTYSGAYTFDVSPNQNGPWQTRIVGDCFSCSLPPGVTQQTGAAGWSGPLPPGNNWWRVTLAYTEIHHCWSFNIASDPQPACVLPTITPSTTLTPTLPPGSTPTTTPTTPILTPTATPTCCSGVTGSITSSCQGTNYAYTFTLTNTCTLTVPANGGLFFEVSPNPTGPWTSPIHFDYFNFQIPPGVSQYSGSIWTGPLPPGNNWWRTRLYLSPGGPGYCWQINVVSDPQPACVLPTVTPSSTSPPTSTATPTTLAIH